MFKQIKKLFIALVLVFSLCLVACGEECEECEDCPTGLIKPEECPENGYIKKEDCPAGEECPSFDVNKECSAAGWTKECEESGIIAPTSVEFYTEDVKVGESAEFEVEIAPASAYKGLVWSSSDPSIATVDADGKVTGVRPGKVTITATSVINSEATYEEEIDVVESGLLDFEIAEREKNSIVEQLNQGYVSADFDLPTTWNQNAVVTYLDAEGKEITKFVMPDLGEATSKNYQITGNVAYGESVSEFSVSLNLVAAGEGKNDYEKVNFAVEVAESFLYQYVNGSEKVSESIYLPTSVYGVSLGWSTNKAYVLTSDGEFTKPNNDTSVTYTITPKCGAASKSTTFTVVAEGYAKDKKIDYLKKEGALKDINGKKFFSNIALPEKDDKFGIKLTYVSNNEKVISNEGKITTPLKDTKVTITVTAVYEDLNSPADAFVEVFDIEVTAGASTTSGAKEIADFAADHEQLRHIPYGMGTERTWVINETEAAELKAEGFTFTGDSNFKVNTDGSVELVTQYFRYHEAKLVAKCGDATYTWVINVGIGEVNDIVYIGGRAQNYQASANPTERGDMLQGFSKWDKYVGVISNNSERTVQQYWSEFSGYTMYVDAPTGDLKVIFTKDADGNVTVTPTDEKDYVRYQMFMMEFGTIYVDAKKMYADTDADGKGDTEVWLPVVKEGTLDAVRSTYTGYFSSFYVNVSGRDIELPVSALSMAGTFADGVAMKTYTKSSISLSAEKGKAVAEVKDDYGKTLKVARNETWAWDGYRPGFMLKRADNVDSQLAEGSTGEYKFTIGYQDALNNPNNNNTGYIQYGISSKESVLWGTTYVTLPKNGLGFIFRSQELYSFSKINGAYICGEGELPVVVERYYRHAENEELSDYVVADIKAYLIKLVDGAADKSGDDLEKALKEAIKNNGSGIKFEDISVDTLKEIEALKARYDALYASWKTKEAVATAGARIDAIIAAAQTELEKQTAYANIAEQSFLAVKEKLVSLADMSEKEIEAVLSGTEMDALVAAAERNYASLTEGQKSLYDKGYDGKHLEFQARNTDWILEVLEVETTIITLNEKVTDTAAVKAASKAYEALKKLIAGKVEVLPSTSTAAPSTSTSTSTNTPAEPVYENIYANAFVSKWSQKKLAALLVASNILEVEADATKIAAQKTAYSAAADKDIINKSFEAFKTDELDGIYAFFAAKEKEAEEVAAAAVIANKAETVELAKAIKAAASTLPTAAQIKKTGLDADQVKTLNDLMLSKDSKGNATNKFAKLVALYAKLGKTPSADTDAAKIAMLVAGFTKPDKDDATKTVIDEEYGNFAGEDEKELLEKLVACPAAYDEYVANQVIDAIDSLPGVSKTTLEDEAAIKAARAAYKALSASQKAIADNNYQSATAIETRLSNLETKIAELKTEEEVAPIVDAIDSLPLSNKVTIEDEEAIKAARKLYDAIKDDDKLVKAVGTDAYNKLVNTENKLTQIKQELVENSDVYKAAKSAFAANTKVNGTINKDSKAEAETLLAYYNAMDANEKEYFAEKFEAYQLLADKIISALKVYNKYVAE